MKKVLVIHGFGGSKNSETGLRIKSILEKMDPLYNVTLETFDLLDIKGTQRKIKNIMSNPDYCMIISHSLGAFYCLGYTDSVAKIVINPCMKPSIELPKLLIDCNKEENESFNKNFNSNIDLLKEDFSKAEDAIYTGISSDRERQYTTYGVFGTNDELFSYKDLYKSTCNASERMFTIVNSGHKLSEVDLEVAIYNAMDYFRSL